jgi:hypothetical protein
MGGKVALLVVLVAMSVVLLETQAKTKPKAEEKPPKTKEHRLPSHPDKPPPYRKLPGRPSTRRPHHFPTPPLLPNLRLRRTAPSLRRPYGRIDGVVEVKGKRVSVYGVVYLVRYRVPPPSQKRPILPTNLDMCVSRFVARNSVFLDGVV